MTRWEPAQTSDAIREALDQVFSEPAYQWHRPRSLFDVVGGWLNGINELLQRLHADHPLGYYVVVGLLTLVLLAILTHFGYILWQAIKPQRVATAPSAARASASRGAAWYLQRAHQLMLAGRHAEALGFRFRSLLLTLDRRRLLSFHPAKTPAEYASELRLDQYGQGVFRSLVEDLYRHVFGAVPCTAADAQRFDATAAGLEGNATSH